MAYTEKYIAYASVFYDSFKMRENRGVFWWAAQKLLDNLEAQVSFKSLRLFLSTAPRKPYSPHIARSTLVRMQDKSYVTLINPGNSSKLTSGGIKDSTIVKLEPAFSQAVARHAANFKARVASDYQVVVDDLNLYMMVNQFYRGPYYAEWGKFLSGVGALGQQLGGETTLQIEQNLIGYSPNWITINFLWAQYLRSLIGGENRTLRFDHLHHDLNRVTFVTCVSACNFDPLSWGIGVQN